MSIVSSATLLVLFCTVGFAQGPIVDVRLDQNAVYPNQPVIMTVEVRVNSQPVPVPNLPKISGLTFLQRGNPSSFTNVFNGRVTYALSFAYQVRASTPGVYKIHPVTISTPDGSVISGNPVTLTVLSPEEKLPETLNYFLKAEVSKDKVYVNEPVLLTLRQYSKYKPTSRINLNLNTNIFKGFWHEVIPKDQLSLRTENIDGIQYYVVDLREIILFPISSGLVILEPVELQSVLEGPSQRRKNTFFEDFFQQNEMVQVEMSSNPVKLTVLPLPEEGKPTDFSGAVGKFSVRSAVNKTDVKVGELITLKVTLQGVGNLKNIPEPSLPPLDGFDRYESLKNERISISDGTLGGEVDFEYLLTPRTVESNMIGPVKMSYFNPQLNRYETAESPPIQLHVLPSDRPMEDMITLGGRQTKINILGEDLRYIHTGPEALKNGRSNNWGVPVLISAHAFPVAMLLAFIWFVRRKRILETHPDYARSLKAPRHARKNLQECRRLLEQHDPPGFYAALQRLLIQYFSHKFNAPIQGMTAEERFQFLKSKLQNEEKARQVEQILALCDEGRFAPSESQPQRMKDLFEQAREIIEKK